MNSRRRPHRYLAQIRLLAPVGSSYRTHLQSEANDGFSGVEYWQFAEPAITSNVKMCVDDDDQTCSRSVCECLLLLWSSAVELFLVVSTGVNVAHMVYFGQGK